MTALRHDLSKLFSLFSRKKLKLQTIFSYDKPIALIHIKLKDLHMNWDVQTGIWQLGNWDVLTICYWTQGSGYFEKGCGYFVNLLQGHRYGHSSKHFLLWKIKPFFILPLEVTSR